MRFLFLCAAALVSVSTAHAAEVFRGVTLQPRAHLKSESTNPLAGVRLEDLAVTRERPLFSPTRRPPPHLEPPPPPSPPPPVEEKAEAPAPAPFDLLGAVVGADASYVLLRDRASNEVIRLTQGDEKEGWKIGAVNVRSVMLERAGRMETLTLAGPSAAQPAPQLAGAGPAFGSADPLDGANTPRQDSPPLAEYNRLMRKLNLH